MTDLYRINGGAPEQLPAKLFAANGDAYTAPYLDEDADMLGIEPAPPHPGFDPATEFVVWDDEAGAWRVDALPPPPQPPPISSSDVDAERDRRIIGGVTFDGVRYQTRPGDRENIMGAFALANAALTVGGKQPGDLRWHDGVEDFVFIAEDNSRVPMDAVTVLRLGQAAARQKSDNTFAANDLKLADPIPPDFADDAYWPAR